MSLRVIDEACRMEHGKLIVVVEGDRPDIVNGSEAKRLAVKKAETCGYMRIGINGSSGSYPVDSEGNTYEDWNEQARQGAIVAYRNDIKLMSSSV